MNTAKRKPVRRRNLKEATANARELLKTLDQKARARDRIAEIKVRRLHRKKNRSALGRKAVAKRAVIADPDFPRRLVASQVAKITAHELTKPQSLRRNRFERKRAIKRELVRWWDGYCRHPDADITLTRAKREIDRALD